MPKYGSRSFKDDETMLSTYRHRVLAGEREFKKWEPHARQRLRRYRLEKHVGEYTGDGHRVTVTEGIGTIDALFAALTATEVDVTVRNLGTGTRDQAKLAEAGLREVWRETKVDRKSDRAVKEALLISMGALFVGYEYAEEEVTRPRSEEDLAADVGALFDQASERGDEVPTVDQVRRLVPSEETVTEAVRDRIVVEHVPWDELLYDPTAKHWEDVRWVCRVYSLPVEEVRNNPAYREYVAGSKKGLKKLRELGADSTVHDRESVGDTNAYDDHEDEDRITVYCMYDFDTGMVTEFPKADETLILDEYPNPFAQNDDLEDKNPFVPLVLREDLENPRGISDMEVITPLLDELTEYRSNLATYIARTIPKLLVREGTMSEQGKEALKSKDWAAVIEMTDDPGSVKPLEPPSLPQEVFAIPDKLVQSIREATGVSELDRGLFPDRKRTATETNTVKEAGSIRQAEKRNRMERFYEDLARRILMLMQMFYDHERISRIIELDKDVEWSWTSEDITMEAKLEIGLTAKQPLDDVTRRQFAIEVLNLVAPMPFIDIEVVVKWAFEEAGLHPELVREFLKSKEQQQEEAMAALQQQEQEQAVADGEAPSPASVPGPESAEELAANVNPGTIPPEVAASMAMAFNREVGLPDA